MKITYNLIKSLNPCYNSEEIGIMSGYEVTIPEFINEYRGKVKSKDDIQGVLLRPKFMSDRDLRLFAVWCARQVQHLMNDQRSINALNVAERFANELATEEELAVARAVAQDAAWDAARAVARAVAWDAARDAARDAAWDAARDAAWDAARDAAWDAARDAARDAQIDKLLEFFIAKENNQNFDWGK